MAEKVFLLGLGTARSGSTWLYRVLRGQPEFGAGFAKEYHIWDTATLGIGPQTQPDHPPAPDRPKAEHGRHRMLTDPEFYFDYFHRILSRPGTRMTADFTPAYCGLKAETLRRIADGFDRRGIEVRAIFVMRDPVERCLSGIRRRLPRLQKLVDNGRLPPEAAGWGVDEVFLAQFRLPGMQSRTRYDLTISEIEKALPAENVFYGIYEELFDPDHLARLSAFLGLTIPPALAEQRFNASEAAARPRPETLARVAQEYDQVYQFCAERFPQTRVLWQNAART